MVSLLGACLLLASASGIGSATAVGRPATGDASVEANDLALARRAVLAQLAAPASRSALSPSGGPSIPAAAPPPAKPCSGDSRAAGPPQPPGRTELVPATFGSTYDCANDTWTYWVKTSAPFEPTRFGAWTVLVDTDGTGLFVPLAANCYGAEFVVAAYQTPTGGFAAQVAGTTGDCGTVTSTVPASVSVGPAEVDVTFAATALIAVGPHGTPTRAPSLRWAGNLSTMTEVLSDQPGDDVPASGSISDALPLLGAPPPCSVSSAVTSPRGAGPNPETGPIATPDDPGYAAQWALAAVGAPGAWSVSTGDPTLAVADINTGVNGSHPDLSGQLVTGVDLTGTSPVLIPPGTDDDGNGRGTAVAGAIAAATDNGLGLASLGWQTKVLPVKASTDATFSPTEVAAAIEWIVHQAPTVDPGVQVRVINLSLSGPCDDPGVRGAIADAQAAGLLVVAAAGGGAAYAGAGQPPGDDYVSFPASLPGVLAVGALGRDGYRAPTSQTGPYLSLAAPGGVGAPDPTGDDLAVLAPGALYATAAGSGLASAEVAAAASLVWSRQPTWTAARVADALETTADDIGVAGTDLEYGHGRLDAGAALAAAGPSAAGSYVPVASVRALDTRSGVGAPAGPIGSGRAIDFAPTGVGQVPGSGVAAVVLHLTAVNETAPTYLTVWPRGQARPLASNVNADTNTLANNLVIVPVGVGGEVSVYNSFGTSDVVADVTGWFSDGTTAAGSTFVGTTPTRLLDTRDGTGLTRPGALGPDGRLKLVAAGRPDSPVPAGATAAVINLTAVGPSAATFLQAYLGPDPPGTATLNANLGQTVANLAIVPLGADGASTVRNAFGTTDVVADVVGYFVADGGTPFHPLSPTRILDTRDGTGGFGAPVRATPITVTVAGRGGVPTTAKSVVLNVTATDTTAPGYLTLYPADGPRPLASNLNFLAGATVPNLVAVKLSPTGQLTIFNFSGSTDVVADVAGWFG